MNYAIEKNVDCASLNFIVVNFFSLKNVNDYAGWISINVGYITRRTHEKMLTSINATPVYIINSVYYYQCILLPVYTINSVYCYRCILLTVYIISGVYYFPYSGVLVSLNISFSRMCPNKLIGSLITTNITRRLNKKKNNQLVGIYESASPPWLTFDSIKIRASDIAKWSLRQMNNESTIIFNTYIEATKQLPGNRKSSQKTEAESGTSCKVPASWRFKDEVKFSWNDKEEPKVFDGRKQIYIYIYI